MGTTTLLVLATLAAGVWAAFFLKEFALVTLLAGVGLLAVAAVAFVNDESLGLVGLCAVMGVLILARGIHRLRRGSKRTD